MGHSYKVEVEAPDGQMALIEMPVKPSVRTKAAIAVLAVLARNGGPIADEAEQEDAAETLASIAQRTLGELRRPAALIETTVTELTNGE